jgi:hypothetical protein
MADEIPWEDECEDHKNVIAETAHIMKALEDQGAIKKERRRCASCRAERAIKKERRRCASCRAERDPFIQWFMKREFDFTEH